MSISRTFRKLHGQAEGALIAFITGGDPSPELTPQIIEALIDGGADIIEIGIPFSDPIADGPTIQAADHRALNAGTTPQKIFDIVKEAKRKKTETPIVLLSYYNILFKMGLEAFMSKANGSGVDGVIVPDLPIEEAEEYRESAWEVGIDTIFLASPLTSERRLKDILESTRGFLYLVALLGVTGTRDQVSGFTVDAVKRIHLQTMRTIPLAVGFGISRPEHIRTVMDCGAEGAIVGSAFVNLIEENLAQPNRIAENVSELVMQLKTATKTSSNKNPS
jgi:tryptophan synthase alpha chain